MDGKISNIAQVGSLRRYVLTEGKQAGLRVIECDTGKIRFLLNESKALDVMQMYHCGQNISFVSKNGFSAAELPFLRRFEGGMVYSCGLDALGDMPGHEMHGSLHNIPAQVTRAEFDGKEFIITARMADSALFGKNFVLTRTIRTSLGSETFTLEDELENCGTREEEFCLLYHTNVGYPMLDEGAEVVAELECAVPRTAWAAENLAERSKITAAVPNQEEMCYFLQFKMPKISLVNARLGKTFTLAWSGDTLPCFVQWKSMASGDYGLGLEPATTLLDEGFRYTPIAPGQKIRFGLSISVTGSAKGLLV